jgi:phosphoglycolate phosphatase-like HAD superfamily hydrolase
MRAKAEECIVVGDSIVDIKAGKNAGIRTIAVLSGIFQRKELEREKPDLIIENISELPLFLEKNRIIDPQNISRTII